MIRIRSVSRIIDLSGPIVASCELIMSEDECPPGAPAFEIARIIEQRLQQSENCLSSPKVITIQRPEAITSEGFPLPATQRVGELASEPIQELPEVFGAVCEVCNVYNEYARAAKDFRCYGCRGEHV